MPTFKDPATHADEVQAALRDPAHATRTIEDPRQIYPVLGSLSSAVASLSQTLHQLASVHDRAADKPGRWVPGEELPGGGVPGESDAGRAAAFQVSWELHRAGEVLHQVTDSIGRAHNAEGQITYVRRHTPPISDALRPSAEPGLGLWLGL